MTYQVLLDAKQEYKRSHIPKAYKAVSKSSQNLFSNISDSKNDEKKVKILTENRLEQLVQRIVRNLLDIHILRLIQAEPMWGYNIIKKIETLYGIKIRHGALYPLLNRLEVNDYIKSRKEIQKGRIRKTYMITEKGEQIIQTYYNILKQQLKEKDIQS